MRWSDLKANLPDGCSDETIELVRRATAADRAEWRTQETIAAVMAFVGAYQVRSILDAHPLPLLRLARTALAIEANGVRGPLNAGRALGQPATERMQWARALGSGRRHAGDGDAWSAAVIEAEARVAAAVGRAELAAGNADAAGAVSTHDVYSFLGHLRPTDPTTEAPLVVPDDERYLSFVLSYVRRRIAEAARLLAAGVESCGGNRDVDRQAIDDWDDVLSVVRSYLPESVPEPESLRELAARGALTIAAIVGLPPHDEKEGR